MEAYLNVRRGSVFAFLVLIFVLGLSFHRATSNMSWGDETRAGESPEAISEPGSTSFTDSAQIRDRVRDARTQRAKKEDAKGKSLEPGASLDLVFEDPPIDLNGIDARFARDVAYGPHDRNVFDIFLVSSSEPTPLAIHIHGGGFTSGDKKVAYVGGHRKQIRQFLASNVSFATINYRLLEPVDKDGVLKPMTDARRCLQTLRYHHRQLNVDPARVVIYGSSAGAGTCLWLAFNDDMAEPGADDAILRQSTRVLAAGAGGAQSTYDLLKWETIVFASLGLTLEDFAGLPDATEQGLLSFYGAESFDDLSTPEFKAYRAKVDMLALMSADDPPFYVRNDLDASGAPADKNELFHHPLHARALAEQADEIGVEYMAFMEALNVADPSGESVVDFLLNQLGAEEQPGSGRARDRRIRRRHR